MALMDQIAPWRATETCGKKSRIRQGLAKLTRLWKNRKHPHVRSVTPRLARDIGLDQANLAKHQHQWPSETFTHPRL